MRNGGRRRNPAVRITAAAAWCGFVSLVLLWQSAHYQSIMSTLAEWQYNLVGRYYPSFSYLIVVFLLSLPVFVFFGRPRTPVSRSLDVAILSSARTFSRTLFAISAALMIVAAGVLMSVLRLPSDKGPVQDLSLDDPVVTLPNEGPTRIVGTIAYHRTAAFDENLIFSRRSLRFAPVIPAGSDPAHLQFFVELPPATDTTRKGTSTSVGVLRSGGLPGEIVRLYRYAGFRVEDPYYVLYSSTHAVRWPRYALSAQLAALSLVVLLAALWQRRRSRKLIETIGAKPEPAAPATV